MRKGAGMRVLVAVDGSNSSDALIQEVARRPWPAGTRFAVITVVDPYFFTKAPALLEEAKQSAQKSLEAMTQLIEQAGWPVEKSVVLGNTRHALARSASEWRADLVMMGSHGRGTVGRLLVGSTTQAVLRHSECSVEIVRSTRHKPASAEGMRVMVPTDGSEHAEAALRAVAQRPWPKNSVFKVLASPEYPVLVGEYPYFATEQVTDLTKQTLEHASSAVETGAALLAKAGLNVSSEVMEPEDTPAQSILSAAEAWNADLIVLGSHGRRGFDRLILGSVSETVALHAKCSVEVIRKPVPLM